jgi:hypothetical protein
MSKSNAEEMLAALWSVAALLAFENEYQFTGCVFVIFAVIAFIGAVYYTAAALNMEDKE